MPPLEPAPLHRVRRQAPAGPPPQSHALVPRRSRGLVRLDDSAASAGHFGWLIIALFFGLAGTWALLAPLDGAVVAEGVVKIDGERKPIQHLEGGIVRRILVREGDAVAAGAVLVVLDDTQSGAEADVLDAQVVALGVQRARLAAEASGAASLALPRDLAARVADPTVADALEGQQAILAARRREQATEATVFARRIAQLEAQIAGAKAQLAGVEAQRASTADELTSLRPLLAKGIVTGPRILQLERSLSQLSGQLGEVSAGIAKSEQAIDEQRQLAAQATDHRALAEAQERRDTDMRLAEAGLKFASAATVRERTEIRAPYAGRVVGLAVHAVGAVVGRGERLMDIVPDADTLVVEARIAVADLGEIAAGTPAEVRLVGARQKSTPTLRGAVALVSADRLTDPHTGAPYYAVQVAISPREVASAGRPRLQPGMAASVSIATASRSAFEYLIDPLRTSFAKALRER